MLNLPGDKGTLIAMYPIRLVIRMFVPTMINGRFDRRDFILAKSTSVLQIVFGVVTGQCAFRGESRLADGACVRADTLKNAGSKLVLSASHT